MFYNSGFSNIECVSKSSGVLAENSVSWTHPQRFLYGKYRVVAISNIDDSGNIPGETPF